MTKLKSNKIKYNIKLISYIFIALLILSTATNIIFIKSYNNISNVTNRMFGFYAVFSMCMLFILSVLFIYTLMLIKRLINVNIPYILKSFKYLNDFNNNNSFIDEYKPHFDEEKDMKIFIKDIYDEQLFLKDLKDIAANEYILDDVLDKIYNKLNTVIRVDRIGVAFVDYEKRRIIAETGKFNYGNILLGPGFEVSMDQTSLTEIILNKKPIYNNDIIQYLNSKKHKNKSLELIAKEGIKSNMIIPLIINNRVFGFLFFSSFDKNTYDHRSLKIGENIAHSIATIIEKTYLTKRILNNIALTFADLVEKKDCETGNHVNRMTRYSKVIADGLLDHNKNNYRVNSSFIKDINLYAPLHDIGKVGIPDSILNKPSKLTADEWLIMKEHPNIGADILVKFEDSLKIFGKQFYQIAIDITRHHHEKWDGSGYPYGLKLEEIPLAARIVAIADVFDALASRRPYKEPKSFDECVEIIKSGKGSHFDPELVDVFLEKLPKIKKIYDEDFKDNEVSKISS